MKRLFILAALAVASCNPENSTVYKQQSAAKDSLVRRLQTKDSTIMSYINSYNNIQKNIDTLMRDAHVLRAHSEKIKDTGSLISELKEIGKLVIKNQRELSGLQQRLKRSNEQNQGLTDLGEELAKQINEKDSEIAVIQQELVRTRSSLASVVKQLNDSLTVIQQQRSQINVLQIKGNTVYYVVGTEKNLAKDGYIKENGGAIGLGKVPTPGPDMSTSGFNTGDLTTMHEIPLNARFVKLVTPHPSNSYRIATSNTDKLIITDPEDFWSKSKYLIVIVK